MVCVSNAFHSWRRSGPRQLGIVLWWISIVLVGATIACIFIPFFISRLPLHFSFGFRHGTPPSHFIHSPCPPSHLVPSPGGESPAIHFHPHLIFLAFHFIFFLWRLPPICAVNCLHTIRRQRRPWSRGLVQSPSHLFWVLTFGAAYLCGQIKFQIDARFEWARQRKRKLGS